MQTRPRTGLKTGRYKIDYAPVPAVVTFRSVLVASAIMDNRRAVNRSMFWRVLRRSVFANRGRLFGFCWRWPRVRLSPRLFSIFKWTPNDASPRSFGASGEYSGYPVGQ